MIWFDKFRVYRAQRRNHWEVMKTLGEIVDTLNDVKVLVQIDLVRTEQTIQIAERNRDRINEIDKGTE